MVIREHSSTDFQVNIVSNKIHHVLTQETTMVYAIIPLLKFIQHFDWMNKNNELV